MLTEWLLSGDYHVCWAIASRVPEINRDAPCIQISADVLPNDPVDQVFVCRKAIGHFCDDIKKFTCFHEAKSFAIFMPKGSSISKNAS